MTIDKIIDFALKEDLGDGDHTSLSIIPSGSKGKAKLLVKDEGILCGIELAGKIFQHLDATLKLTVYLKDGSSNDGSRYAIGDLQTEQTAYRVYFLIKPVGGQSLIHQLQIQEKN